MSSLPAPLTAAEHDMTPVTVWLDAGLLARLERIVETAQRTHPAADAERVTDLVMAAGIEAVECAAQSTAAACSSETGQHSCPTSNPSPASGDVTPAAEACVETSDLCRLSAVQRGR